MRLEETFAYRCYLCLASMLGDLGSDYLGSDEGYDDSGYYQAHITELFGADIDKVFLSQHVVSVFGKKKWAFTDPSNGFLGDDLRARMFHDRDHDVYYLVHGPTEGGRLLDYITNGMTGAGAGVPDKYKQAAQLIELVRPEFRDKIVLSGFSQGGGLAAYAELKASWMVPAVVFDPLGLNRTMMGERGLGTFGQGEVLSDRFRSIDDFVDWYYIANSYVAKLNIEHHLSSVGRVTELPQDPVRSRNSKDTHDFRHVRFGLHQLWEGQARKQLKSATSRHSTRRAERSGRPKSVHTIQREWASSSGPPDWHIMKLVRGTVLEPLTNPQAHTEPNGVGNMWVWSYPDVSDEVWEHKVRPVIEPRISRLVDKLKIMDGYLT